MIEHPDQEKLGWRGLRRSSRSTDRCSKPMVSMVTKVPGGAFLHRLRRLVHSGVWEEIGQTLEGAGERRIPLPELHGAAKPPFGLRDGIIPLLVVAYMIVEGDELAFYEDETFVPALSAPALERMLRTPERFQVQRFRIAGERMPLFRRLLASLTGGKADHRFSVVPLIKYLVRFMRELPEYSRNTMSVSKHGQGVREAILRAQEPGPLVFDTLPKGLWFCSLRKKLRTKPRPTNSLPPCASPFASFRWLIRAF